MKPLEYLHSLERFKLEGGLKRMRDLLGWLENPHMQFASVLIAGTNGKGSTCAFLNSILQEAGLKVGLYTSPHLVTFTERITINNERIDKRELEDLVGEIKNIIEKHNLDISFFELATASAMLYFSRKKVDIAVFEVGIGGRLDATNVIRPLVSVITNIGCDHKHILGETKEEIAKEKLGICKPDVPLLSAERDPKIRELFYEYAKNVGTKVQFVDEDDLVPTKLGLLGSHQQYNATLALMACKELRKWDFMISQEHITKGLQNASWPARLEWRGNILFDCAHNLEGVQAILPYLKEHPELKTLVLGLSTGDAKSKMISLLAPLFEHIIVCEGNYRAMDASEVAKEALKHCSNVIVEKDPAKALELAQSQKEKILVTGSMYMVGDVLKSLKQSK